MKATIFVVILVIFGLSFTTCNTNNEEQLYPTTNDSCDTTDITFTAKVAPIFVENCVRCHGNSVAASQGGGIRLQDYDDIKLNLNNAYGSMNHSSGFTRMPKDMSSTIDPCKIKIVRIWKDAGAPEN